jgi:outer membrane protein OmpA-like peptidoglycan-associated protein
MSFNLLDAVKGYVSNDVISSAASYLGEDSAILKKGLEVIAPTAAVGIADKLSTDADGVLKLAGEAYDSGILQNFGGLFSEAGGGIPSNGPSLLKGIFGDKVGSVANAISSFTGGKGAATSSLMGTIMPLALALLGKHAKDNNLGGAALASLLGGQRNSFLSMLPGGFDASRIFGTTKVAEKVVHTAHHAAPVVEKKSNLLWPILLGLAGLLLAWWLMRSCNKDEVAAPVPATADTVTVVKTDTVTITKEPIKVTLPNGVELNAYKGGIEDLLVAFLSDPNAKPGNDNWFDFNDLNFEFGTANIVPESRKEVDNIVEILKAFPKAKIKVGGYTDKVGDEAANKKLSGERATAVAEALKTAGVGGQVTGAEGYGSQFAKYPADAPEADRLRDRRVSVSVREK